MPSPLTLDHRRVQLALRAETLRDLLKIWPAFDLSNISRTWPAVERGLLALIQARGATSSGLASAHYRQFRKSQEVPGRAVPRIASIPDTEIIAGLRMAGPVAAAKYLAQGRAIEDVEKNRLVDVAGAVGLYVLNHGRQTILESARADKHATGWERVVTTGACSFCQKFAGRTAPLGADFSAHRSCACTAETVYQ